MRTINKAYKFKLKLNQTQEIRINRMIGSCRWVYNIAKETKENAYNLHGVHLSAFDLIKQLPPLKEEAIFLKEVSADSLQDVIERLDKAYKAFYKGAGFPKWARKEQYNSITFKSVKKHTHNRVKLPNIGSVKYFASRDIVGELRRATVSRKNGEYFISILTKQVAPESIHLPSENQAGIGIDMGVAYFLVTSDGEFIENPRFFEKFKKELRIAQRSLRRKKKGSLGWEKQTMVVNKLYLKMKRQRSDFSHKISKELVSNNNFIAVEKLDIKKMLGNNNISEQINDVSWGSFIENLRYKSNWKGSLLVKVDPSYTSQTCVICGHVSKENRLSQDKFECIKCGYEANADLNAAQNIMDRALSSFRKRKPIGYALERNSTVRKMSNHGICSP